MNNKKKKEITKENKKQNKVNLFKARLEEKIFDSQDKIIDSLIENAVGVEKEKIIRVAGEEPRIIKYRMPGDTKAATEILDRVLGKPSQTIELQGDFELNIGQKKK
jgi:hypothetical protein